MRERCSEFVRKLQDTVSAGIEAIDGKSFREDIWERPEGGGGRTRVLEGGNVFEKAGVNTAAVTGELSEDFAREIPGEGLDFFATGISLVLHPASPMVPTVHANFRYVEKGGRSWFGGGADLTPYYIDEDDIRHFHSVWKAVCDRHDSADHARFKEWCDDYFFLSHRGEARGVGGIFFDYLEGDKEKMEKIERFWRDAGEAFLESYIPIVQRRMNDSYGDREREFQELRRGRYVEFNLIYDRGTKFGLRTGGRTESILMSLPPTVRFQYDRRPEPGSPEALLVDVLRKPRDWI